MSKLPQTVNDSYDVPVPPREAAARTLFALATAALFFSAFLTWSALPTSPLGVAWPSESMNPIERRKLWAHNTPYFPLTAYRPIPSNCELTQVCTTHLIHINQLTSKLGYHRKLGSTNIYIVLQLILP